MSNLGGAIGELPGAIVPDINLGDGDGENRSDAPTSGDPNSSAGAGGGGGAVPCATLLAEFIRRNGRRPTQAELPCIGQEKKPERSQNRKSRINGRRKKHGSSLQRGEG